MTAECVNQVGLRSQDLEILWAIFAFLFEKKTIPYGKNFQKFVPKVFTSSPIDVVVFKCRKICPTRNRRNRALFTWPKNNKNSAASQTVRTAIDRAQNLPGPAPSNVLTFLQISPKSVHFRRSYNRTCEHHFCPVYFQYSPEAVLRFRRIIKLPL